MTLRDVLAGYLPVRSYRESRRFALDFSRRDRLLRGHTHQWPLYVCIVLVAWALIAIFLHSFLIDPWDDGERAFGLLAGGFDVVVYRDAARRFLEGAPVYSERLIHGLYYVYPPFSAVLFLPLTMWPLEVVKIVWFLLSLILLAICILRCFWALGYRISPRLLIAVLAVTAVGSFLEPIRTTLFYGQVNIVLLILVVFDITATRTGLRGLGVGLAASIKVTPGFFIFHYLALRKLRAAAVASTTFAATIAIGWMLVPVRSERYWLHEMMDSTRIGVDLHPGNQSIRGMIAHLTNNEAVPIWQWPPLALAVGAIGLYFAARLHRRGDVLLPIALAGLTSSMVSPFSWGHHWVWVVPLLVHLVHLARQNPRWWLACGLVFAITGSWVEQFPDVNAVGLFLFTSPWKTFDTVILTNMFPWGYFVLLLWAISICRADPEQCADRRARVPARNRE